MFQITDSDLLLMDSQGRLVAAIEDPYADEGRSLSNRRTSGGIRGYLHEILAADGAESYSAIWIVNGVYSNAVSFRIVPYLGSSRSALERLRRKILPGSRLCARSLTIEPLLDSNGTPMRGEFLAYFQNTSDETVDLAHAWAGSKLIKDGKDYGLKAYVWIGSSKLGSGESWATTVKVDGFRLDLEPGVHLFRLRFANCLSNPVSLRTEE